MQHGELRPYRGSRLVKFVFKIWLINFEDTFMTGESLLNILDSCPAAVSSKHVERQERGDPCHSDIPEWLQEFRENLVDDRVPEQGDSHVSSSHELS